MSTAETGVNDLRAALQEVVLARQALALVPKSRKSSALMRLAEAERIAMKLMREAGKP